MPRSFLTSALDGGEWSASHYPRGQSSGSRFIGDWMRPNADLDARERKKSHDPPGNRTLIPRSSTL
jgi:hypothetical protein